MASERACSLGIRAGTRPRLPDGQGLATAGADVVRPRAVERVESWAVRRGELPEEVRGDAGRSLTFSPDGRVLASACEASGRVTLWAVATQELAALDAHARG
ncbi:MAG: hypothetical protein WKF75_21320 [Singulisphaera sp.]